MKEHLPFQINITASAMDRRRLKTILEEIAAEIFQQEAVPGGYSGRYQPKASQSWSGEARTDDKMYRFRIRERKKKPAKEESPQKTGDSPKV